MRVALSLCQVRYSAEENSQRELPIHTDSSTYSFNRAFMTVVGVRVCVGVWVCGCVGVWVGV